MDFLHFAHSWRLFASYRELEMVKNSWKIGSLFPSFGIELTGSAPSSTRSDAFSEYPRRLRGPTGEH